VRTREGLPHGHPGCPVTGKRSGRFIDTGKTIRAGNKLEQLLVHEAGALILGRHIGMLDRDSYTEQAEQLINLKHQLAAAEDELVQVNAELDGVDALTRRGLVVRKAPGRPPKKKQDD
jgi:hypothetical protein